MDVEKLQSRLVQLGFDPGRIDGIMGPRTEAAIVSFKRSRGLVARPYVGPVTMAELFGSPQRGEVVGLPWMNEVAKYMGAHETRDFARLFKWLRSDGASVGDPRRLPWCADLVQTAIRLTLPNEPFPGRLGINPYLARNWMEFGLPTGGRMGAVAVFWRTHRTASLNGHVGFVIGRDPERGLLRIRGGNQGNAVTDAWLGEDRLLGFRAPLTYPNLPPLPVMNGAGAIISTNEA